MDVLEYKTVEIYRHTVRSVLSQTIKWWKKARRDFEKKESLSSSIFVKTLHIPQKKLDRFMSSMKKRYGTRSRTHIARLDRDVWVFRTKNETIDKLIMITVFKTPTTK